MYYYVQLNSIFCNKSHKNTTNVSKMKCLVLNLNIFYKNYEFLRTVNQLNVIKTKFISHIEFANKS